MAPKLKPGQLLLASALFKSLKPGQVVILQHDDKEKVKRIERVDGNKIFVIGDNLLASTDSRNFGWLSAESIMGIVYWPRTAK